MKRYNILDKASNHIITGMDMRPLVIDAKNGKSALQKFISSHAMSSGMYEFCRDPSAHAWYCYTSYGAYFTAMEVE